MKQAKLLLLLLLTFAMLFACGCNHTDEPKDDVTSTSELATQALETKEPTAHLADEASETPIQTLPPSDSPVEKLTCTYEIPDESFISLDYATDELMKQYKAYEAFDETEDSENQAKVIFKISSEVKNVRFLEISFDETGEKDDTNFIVNKVLYSKNVLLPETPLVVGTVFHGSFPTRAISFVDENNTTRYYSLDMSGKDSSLFLLELIQRDDT